MERHPRARHLPFSKTPIDASLKTTTSRSGPEDAGMRHQSLRHFVLEEQVPQPTPHSILMPDDIHKPHILTHLAQEPRGRRGRRVDARPLLPDCKGLLDPGTEGDGFNDGWCDDSGEDVSRGLQSLHADGTHSFPRKTPQVTGLIESASDVSKSPFMLPAK